MEHGHVIGIFGGCHRATGLFSTATLFFTSPPWRWVRPRSVSTHSSVGFVYQDGYREIYEAREGKSWQGPIPVSKVEAWAKRNKKRRFTMYDIPRHAISQESMVRKITKCEMMLQIWSYSKLQLPRMGLRQLIPFLPMKPTPNRVVCSEAGTLILGPEVDVCRLVGKKTPDRVTPYDFERAMKIITAEANHNPADTKDAYND